MQKERDEKLTKFAKTPIRKEIIKKIAEMIQLGIFGFNEKWESIEEFTTVIAFIILLFKDWSKLFFDCDEKFVDLILKHFNEEQCQKFKSRRILDKNVSRVFIIHEKDTLTYYGNQGYDTTLFTFQ